MTFNSDLISTGRKIRSTWRDEEEDFLKESSHYSRKQLSALDFLSSVAHAGHQICVHSVAFQSEGTLLHLGTDFFSIAPDNDSTRVHSYSLNGLSASLIEIDITEKVLRSWTTSLFRYEKSFKSLLDELSVKNDVVEIETATGNVFSGTIQMLSDSIVISPLNNDSENQNEDRTLVKKNSTIVSQDAVVSVFYSI